MSAILYHLFADHLRVTSERVFVRLRNLLILLNRLFETQPFGVDPIESNRGRVKLRAYS